MTDTNVQRKFFCIYFWQFLGRGGAEEGNGVGGDIQVIKVTQKDPEGASKCSCVGVGDPGDISERRRH